MEHDETPRTGLTRHDHVKYGGAVVGGGLLAGCIGEGGSEPTTDTEIESTTETVTETEIETPEDSSYPVTMSPVGTVELDEPPQSIFTQLTHHVGMAFALGHGDDVNAANGPAYYDTTWKQSIVRPPGVEVDWADLYPPWEASKEELYELDSGVYLADPVWVVQLEQWDMVDIEEAAENTSPWFGNSLGVRHASPMDEWTGDYECYTLWERFEKVAQMFREEERCEAFAAVHDDMSATAKVGLPPEDEHPSVVLLTAPDIENQAWVYTVGNLGLMTSHIRPLAPHDAFEGFIESGSTVDSRAPLEADPDVLLFLSGMQPNVSTNDLRVTLEPDPVAAETSVVQNGRIYPQGAHYQGSILSLFQLEMSAKQLYFEAFGEWPTLDGGSYPKIPEDEQLFDHQHVADIINDEF